MSDNSAFISYRRSTGYPWARLIWDELQERSLDVFLDLETMRQAGRFDHRILHQIAARPYFLTVLTEGTLDRCVSEDDWVRREIEYAISVDRIVVPLFIPPFEPSAFPDELPPTIAEVLANSNGVTFYSQFVSEALDQLAALLQPVDLDQVELTDEDAEFQALAEDRVRSEPVTPPAPLPPPPPRVTESADPPDPPGEAAIDESTDDAVTDETPTDRHSAGSADIVGEPLYPTLSSGSTWTVYQPEGVDSPQPSDPGLAATTDTADGHTTDAVGEPAPDLVPAHHDESTSDPPEPSEPETRAAPVVAPTSSSDSPAAHHSTAPDPEPRPGPPVNSRSRLRWLPMAAGAAILALAGFAVIGGGDDGDDEDPPDVAPTTIDDEIGGEGVATLSTADGNGYVTAESPLTSENGRHELQMTSAGRLVLRTDGADVWSPTYDPVPGAVAVLQRDDGNFAVYPSLTATTADDVLWAIGLVPGNPVEMSVIDDGGDGFVVLTRDGSEVWRRGAPTVLAAPPEDAPDATSPDDETDDAGLTVLGVVEDPDQPIVDIEFENAGGQPDEIREIRIDLVHVDNVDAGAGTSPPLDSFDVGADLFATGTCFLEPSDLGWDPIAPTSGGVEIRSIRFGGVPAGEGDVPEGSFSNLELRITLTVDDDPGDVVQHDLAVRVPHDPTGPRDGSAGATC